MPGPGLTTFAKFYILLFSIFQKKLIHYIYLYMNKLDFIKLSNKIHFPNTGRSTFSHFALLVFAGFMFLTSCKTLQVEKPRESYLPSSLEPALSEFPLQIEIDVKKLLTFEESSIDLMLPSTLIRFESDCYIVNGNFPKRVLSIITNQGNFDAFPYTYIKGDKKWKK